jgi:cobalt-zinc-cadmium efflux system outer membrane protein
MFVHLRAVFAAMVWRRSTLPRVFAVASLATPASVCDPTLRPRLPVNRSTSVQRMFILCIGLALLGGLGRSASAEGLALRQVITTALNGNKDLQAARFVAAQARARLVQAGLLPNPRLELANKNDYLFANEGEYTSSIGFSQQFPVSWRIARQKDVARIDIDLALAEIREAEWKLAGEVANSFFVVLAQNRQIEARNRLLEFDQKLLDAARKRFSAAEVSELDVNMAQLDLQRVSQERALLLGERTAQLEHLNQLLGRTAAQPLTLDDTLPPTETLPNLSELQRRALERRPDLRSAVLKAARARADTKLAHAETWEDWSVSLGVERSRIAVNPLPPQPSSSVLALSLSVPLPLLDQKQGRVAETIASATQANAQIAALRLSIGNDVASAVADIKRLQQVMLEYQRTILPTSERNVGFAQQGYGRGQVGIADVVQAARQQSELNIAYLNTLNLYLQALAKLRTATAEYLR